jgi:hypothetical protein
MAHAKTMMRLLDNQEQMALAQRESKTNRR